MGDEKEIVLVERKLTAERKIKPFFMRKVVADLIDNMAPAMADAMYEIALAKQYETGFLNAKSMNLDGVRGGGGYANASDWMLDVQKRYGGWRKHLLEYSPMAFSICIRVCCDEHSLEQIRIDERIGWKTAERLLHYGLNEYAIMAGWGDQINS